MSRRTSFVDCMDNQISFFKAATRIQAVYRGRRVRQQIAITRIQTVYRGWWVRQKIAKLHQVRIYLIYPTANTHVLSKK